MKYVWKSTVSRVSGSITRQSRDRYVDFHTYFISVEHRDRSFADAVFHEFRNSRFARRSCSTNSRLRGPRVSAKRMRTSAAQQTLVALTVSRVELSFCVATSVRRARLPNSSRGLPAPMLRRLSSPSTSLSPPRTERDWGGDALAPLPLRGLNPLALRGERWIVRNGRATKSASVQSWSGSTNDHHRNACGFCAVGAPNTLEAQATEEQKVGKSNCICINATSHCC